MRLIPHAVRLGLAALGLLMLGLTTTANAAPGAATSNVSIQGFAFSPGGVTINVGDSVKWTNLDGAPHSARATGGSFDTGTLSLNGSATIPFNTPGTLPYVCGIHGASMSGSVTVNGPATPTPAPPTPTPQPTVAPTPVPTPQPTPQPTIAPAAATPTAAPTSAAPVAVASPATSANATPAPNAVPLGPSDSGPAPLIIAGAVVIVVGLGGIAWLLLRR